MVIYKITNKINNKFYIGKTTKNIKHRFKQHIYDANFYTTKNKGIKTDVIAAIGNWLNFDCIDVIGVLDSYHGGNVKSTVRMVLNNEKIKIS